LSLRPTVVEQVSPRISGLYIFFILLPFSLAATVALFVGAFRRDCLPVPQTPWDLLVLGRESENLIASRAREQEQFPEPDPAVALALVREEETGRDKLVLVRQDAKQQSTPDDNVSNEEEIEVSAVTEHMISSLSDTHHSRGGVVDP